MDTMGIHGTHHLRIARPALDLDRSERFYADGLGLTVLLRVSKTPGTAEHDLLMVGPRGGHWHLEITANGPEPITPTPTVEDLLVFYLGDADPTAEKLAARLVANGGTRVPSHNPYWDSNGVTVRDPDGYRVVLATRTWTLS